MPKADATGLAPEKSSTRTLRHFIVPEGSLFVHRPRSCPFLRWSLGAEALGIKTRRPPAGRSKFFAFCWAGILVLPTRASILSHSMATQSVSDHRLTDVGRKQSRETRRKTA